MTEYAGGLKPRLIYGSSMIHFGADRQPSGTSNYYFRYFRFDATTTQGKNMLSMLLMAMASDRQVDVWYEKSPDEGKTEDNGATKANVAEVVYIGVP